MDNNHFVKKISSIRFLKHNYIGSLLADSIPYRLAAYSFFICNAEGSKRSGSHWVMVAKKNGIVCFGDSLETDPMFYRNIVLKLFDALKILNRVELQEQLLCGLFCIYFAFFLFSNFCLYNVKGNFVKRFLRRHFRMSFYVILENFLCLFWKRCLVNKFFSKTSSFNFFCEEKKVDLRFLKIIENTSWNWI